MSELDVVVVPTTHWDREWYRPFQTFRARLVDAVDRVLELLAQDPEYRFLLDGQSIVCEDYLAVRPHQRDALTAAVSDGRIAIGPWYVQPDSLLPSGETHVRNLREGRRVAEKLGGASRVGYTPDSFGHPAQFPQLFAGFGITTFVYWRGNGSEIDDLPSEYRWVAPDGSEVTACHLSEGYFNAAHLPTADADAVDRLREVVEKLAPRTRGGRVLLLAGIDHQMPAARTRELAEALAERTGWDVRRGVLEDFVRDLPADLPTFSGELLGGRVANLLPGVWSTRTYLKLANRHAETALVGWAEPWAALAALFGAPDERPALGEAWRVLLQNQAHDSICGCSQDVVHDQMTGRYVDAEGLARETARRACERLAGRGTERTVPFAEELDLAVFNPSPHPRTDVVRAPLDFLTTTEIGGEDGQQPHPWLVHAIRSPGLEADGEPVRVTRVERTDRLRLLPDQRDRDLEFVARDVPAFGWKRVRLTPAERRPDQVDDGRRIAAGDTAVEAAEDGTLTVTLGERRFAGLAGLEDLGDRGDTYDADPVGEPAPVSVVDVGRRVHPSGIQTLTVDRVVDVPALDDDREGRTGASSPVTVSVTARVAPGVDRVDLDVAVDNTADDHRLRLTFPTGAAVDEFRAATTFDVARRSPEPRDDTGWAHPAPTTFPQQGWVHAGGLTVVAPGLPEAEVTPDGTVAITLLRSVGWLSRHDLRSRPEPAGPGLPTPGAQCHGRLEARLALRADADPRGALDTELGLLAAPAGPQPLVDDGVPLVTVTPTDLVLSALEPALDGPGLMLRVLNPGDEDATARVTFGFDVGAVSPVRLDGEAADHDVTRDGRDVGFAVPAHALRTVLVRPPT